MTSTLKRRIELARRKRAAQVERLWRMGGWLGICVTLVVSLTPPMLNEFSGHTDKLIHLTSYALLMFW